MLAGTFCLLVGSSLPEWSKHDKERPLVLQVGGWAMGQSPIPIKPYFISETSSTLNQSSLGAAVWPFLWRFWVKAWADQTFSDPETQLKIGNWNVRSICIVRGNPLKVRKRWRRWRSRLWQSVSDDWVQLEKCNLTLWNSPVLRAKLWSTHARRSNDDITRSTKGLNRLDSNNWEDNQSKILL